MQRGHERRDAVPRPDPGNLARLAAALRGMSARVLNAGGEGLAIEGETLPRAGLWQFATPHGAIDVVYTAPGAPPYARLRERALMVRLGDFELAVAGRDDLIGMKRAAGRPSDLEDVAVLTEPEHRDRA